MEITYLGHSAFRIRGKDVAIVTDPYPPALGIKMGKVGADIVSVSHRSPNHSFEEGVDGAFQVVGGPGEYEISEVLIAGVATGHEPMAGPTNTAHVFRLDDLAVCHLGDAREKLTNQQVEELGSIDVLLLPVGGSRALNASQASEVVAQLEPLVIVPMHYRLNGGGVQDLDPVDLFMREMGAKEFEPLPKLSVAKNSLPADVQVVVLEHRRVNTS